MMKLFIFTLVVLAINSASIAAETIVKIVTEDAYPLSYLDPKDSIVKGSSTEVIRQVMNDTGLDYSISVLPWARAYQQATNEPITLIYSLARLPDREEQFIWLEKIIELRYDFYTADKNLLGSSIQDVKNLPVAVLRKSVSHLTLIKNGFTNFVFINNAQHARTLLKRDRLHLFYGSRLWFGEIMRKNPSKLHLLELNEFDTLNIALYFAINPETKPAIIEKISSSFKKTTK